MKHPNPDDKEDLLSKILFSGKPYDPCDLTDPRNSFLLDDDQDDNSNTDDNKE